MPGQYRINEMKQPYFRDFSRLSKQFKGKSWIAPPLLFKADKALFFPNLVGRTLATAEGVDTTHMLVGGVSVVAVYTSTWAERQAATFLDGLEGQAPELKDGPVRRVDVNIEENWLRAAILKMCIPRMRTRVPMERHDRYFIIEKGLTKSLKHDLGLWNGKVGYVYLVDWACRIRWAASGNAEPGEREALVRGLKRLAYDWKNLTCV